MQFVVGATQETDRTLVETVAGLRTDGGVHHPQFSAFRPIARTPMENVAAAPALREHRLYQAAHLLPDDGERAVGYGDVLTPEQAHGLFNTWCSRPYAQGFLLYKLYSYAAVLTD